MAVSQPDLRVYPAPREAATAAAAHIAQHLNDSIAARGAATFAVSGGSTPKPMFEDLVSAGLDWAKIQVFWVDERCVPPDHDQSNFKLANDLLLKPAGVAPENIHRVFGELTPNEAALKYIGTIKNVFHLAGDALPVFDVLHRGMGPDAHTASLFPGEPLIGNRTGIAAAVWVEKMKSHRVTLLPGVLLAARHTVIQAVGVDKAEPLFEVLKGPDDPFRFPCQIAARNSDTAAWFLDRDAAARL